MKRIYPILAVYLLAVCFLASFVLAGDMKDRIAFSVTNSTYAKTITTSKAGYISLLDMDFGGSVSATVTVDVAVSSRTNRFYTGTLSNQQNLVAGFEDQKWYLNVGDQIRVGANCTNVGNGLLWLSRD